AAARNGGAGRQRPRRARGARSPAGGGHTRCVRRRRRHDVQRRARRRLSRRARARAARLPRRNRLARARRSHARCRGEREPARLCTRRTGRGRRNARGDRGRRGRGDPRQLQRAQRRTLERHAGADPRMSGANVDIAVVVLAAGEARRFGRAKQLALLDGAPMVRRAAIAALRTGARVAVVTGAYREEVETTLRDLPLGRVYNADWASGMGGSIAAGIAWLDALEPIASAAIVALADQPRIGAAELLELIRAHREDATSIVAARYGEITGPPCLFPR